MYALVLVVFSVVAKHAYGEKTGAPSESCKSMTPFHLKSGPIPVPVPGQLGQSPYTFEAMWDKKKRMIRVSVSDASMAGFLIQGRLSRDGPAVGTFVNIAENPEAKYQDCSKEKFSPHSSVTHTRSSKKEKLVLFWQPPEALMNSTKNVTFYGTLVQSLEDFWVMEETNSLGLAALEPLEDDKPQTNEPTNKPTSDPTNDLTNGSNTVSVGASLLSILLTITIKVSMF